MKKVAVMAFSAISLAGCATGPGTKDEVIDGCTISHDSFQGLTTIKAPKMYFGRLIDNDWFMLRSVGGMWLELYVKTDTHGEWPRWTKALDLDRNRFEISTIDTDATAAPSGVTYSDHLSVSLTLAYLESRRTTGLLLQFYSDSKSIMVEVPAFYVDGFLDRYGTFLAEAEKSLPGG